MHHSIPRYSKIAFFLILLLLLTASGCVIWIFAARSSKAGSACRFAEIYQDGELLESIPLDSVAEAYTFTVTGKSGGRNEIEVRPGSIGIISADCPDRLCVHQGFISTSLLPVTCLPNHLVIQIRTEEDLSAENPPDIFTY